MNAINEMTPASPNAEAIEQHDEQKPTQTILPPLCAPDNVTPVALSHCDSSAEQSLPAGVPVIVSLGNFEPPAIVTQLLDERWIDKNPFAIYFLDEIRNLPATSNWLLDNLFCRGEFALLYGDGGSGKSYLAVDIAMAVASGTSFCGEQFMVPQSGQVVYASGEGRRGLAKRFSAVEESFRQNGIVVDPNNICILHDVPQLFNTDTPYNPERFVTALRERGIAAPDLIIIDTLQRAAVGADENYAKDIGIILGRIILIQQLTGAAILLIHHANKDGGVRGSTALRNSADVVLEARKVGENQHELICSKIKDGDWFSARAFHFEKCEESSIIVWEGEAVHETELERLRKYFTTNPGNWYTAKQIEIGTEIPSKHLPRVVATLDKAEGREAVMSRLQDPERASSKTNPVVYRYIVKELNGDKDEDQEQLFD